MSTYFSFSSTTQVAPSDPGSNPTLNPKAVFAEGKFFHLPWNQSLIENAPQKGEGDTPIPRDYVYSTLSPTESTSSTFRPCSGATSPNRVAIPPISQVAIATTSLPIASFSVFRENELGFELGRAKRAERGLAPADPARAQSVGALGSVRAVREI